MAALVASVPLPLLLDSLLASSWTWLALSLATIATLLRALSRISLSRHRPQALLPPPPSILSLEEEQTSSFISKVLPPLCSTQKCRSLVSENLLQEPDGLHCREPGLFSCIRDCHVAPSPTRDAALTPEISDGQPCSLSRESSEGALGSCPHTIDCKLNLRLRVGFLVDTQKGAFKSPSHGFIKEDVSPPHLWTSDVFSRCKPPHNSFFDFPYSSLEEPLSFELQFGWHKLLETRLGAPWRNCLSGLARASTLLLEPFEECVVKVWSTHQRNLLKALMIEESSVSALDVNIAGGLACTACKSGKISQWDITNQACLTRVSSTVKSKSALCLNAEKGVAIAGNGEFLGLWDYKCPNLISIFDASERPVKMSPYSALRCEGDILHIHRTNGGFSSFDLRKPQGSCLSIDINPDSLPVLSTMGEDEESLVLWEKLACDEEDVWDECNMDHGDVMQRSSSFTSKCATLVRSLSTSGR